MGKNLKIIVLLTLFAFCVWIIFHGFSSRHKLISKHNFVNGAVITKYENGGRYHPGSFFIDYTFTLNQKKYSGSSSISKAILTIENFEKYFQKHAFPVVYESNNPQNSQLLMLPSNFKIYEKKIPDSLEWVLQYIE